MNGNSIIRNASEIVTCSGFEAKKGKEMSDLAIKSDQSLLIEEGKITAIGDFESFQLAGPLTGYTIIDAKNKSILPGFVDSHTHFVFGGYRLVKIPGHFILHRQNIL